MAHTLTPAQASYVIDQLLADRRINLNDVAHYMSKLRRDIEEVETRLAGLRGATGTTKPAPASAPAATAPAKPKRVRRRPAAKPDPQRQASMQLQGRYLGLLQKFTGRKREQFKKLALEKGREAAITAMQSAVGK